MKRKTHRLLRAVEDNPITSQATDRGLGSLYEHNG
jgi:hypothetical protein